MKKRIYALTLVVCLVLNMVSGVAFAEESADPSSGHTPGNKVEVVKPTCTDPGKWEIYCQDEDCGIKLDEGTYTLEPHKPEAQPCAGDELAATCTEDGHNWIHCATCNNLIKKDQTTGDWVITNKDDAELKVDALGHHFVTVKEQKPTCLVDGWKEYRCCDRVIDDEGNTCGTYEPGHEKETILARGEHGELVAIDGYDPKCSDKPDPDGQIDYSVPAKCVDCGEPVTTKITVAAPHVWKNVPGKEATCLETGYTAYEECENCGRKEGYEELGLADHKYTKWLGSLAGSCFEDGRIGGWVCEVCGKPDPERGPKPVTAPGHHTPEIIKGYDPGCETTGLTDGEQCKICKEIIVPQTIIPAKGHKFDKMIPGTKATCTEDGEGAYYLCSVCDAKDYVDPAITIIPKHGHSNEDGYYPEDGNPNAGAVRDHEDDGYPDTWSTEAEKFPTCTEEGYKPAALCSFCDGVLVDSSTIPATGHAWALEEEGKLPTCTEKGITDKWCCTNVDKNNNNAPCQETKGAEPIQPLDHHLVPVEEQLPDCENDGHFAYEYCDREGCNFATNKEYVDKTTGLVEMYDSRVGKVVAELGSIETDDVSVFTVPAYDHQYRQDVKAKEPTCTENGIKDGATRCLVCEKVFDLQLEPAKGHAIVNVDGVEATCTENGKKSFVYCSVCGKAAEGKMAADGMTEGEANAALTASEITVVIDNGQVQTPEEFIILATGHVPTAGVPKDATCTETGLTAGSFCSVCGATLEEQQETSALGHDMQLVKEGKAATCTEDGVTDSYECSRCGAPEGGEPIQATGHTAERFTPVKEPTCEDYGFTTGVHCGVCTVDYDAIKDYLIDLNNNHATDYDPFDDGWVVVPKLIQPTAHENKIVSVSGRDATCTETGVEAYHYCKTCGKAVADKDVVDNKFAAALTESEIVIDTDSDETPEEFIIDALGHEWLEMPAGEAIAPTCTKAGSTGVIKECQRCHEVEGSFVAALGHNWVHHDAVEATCATEGNIEYESCDRCNLYRVDGTEHETYNVVIEQPKNDDGSLKHGDKKHINPEMATCTRPGHTDGWECSVCGTKEYKETEPDAEAYHAYLKANLDKLVAEEVLEWTDSVVGDPAVPGSGTQVVLCNEEGCNVVVGIRLWPVVEKGDVNMDGEVDSIDALMILQYIAGVIDTLPNMVVADYNGVDGIDSVDALDILNALANN